MIHIDMASVVKIFFNGHSSEPGCEEYDLPTYVLYVSGYFWFAVQRPECVFSLKSPARTFDPHPLIV